MTALPADAQAIIDRLAAVDRTRPVIDQARVEVALRDHLNRLGLAPIPVRWVTDAEMGYRLVYDKESAAENAARNAAERAARRAAWSAALSAAWRATESAAWSAAWSAAESAGWRATESAAWSAAESAAESAAGSAGWSAAWRATESAARNAAWSAAESAAGSAAWSAAGSAAWSATRRATESAAGSAARDRWIGIWLPFVDAYEAGLWLFWVTADEIIAVPRPALRLDGDRLHCLDGPAVQWPGGASYYFVRGVQVPTEVITTDPATWPVQSVLNEPNAEVRRVRLDRFGWPRLLAESGAHPLHQDDTGTLYRINLPGDEPLALVHVVNATPEPDGSVKRYVLRVPPTITRAREAVAWTFDVPEAAYRPAVET
jgi:hypothetical protein